MTDMKYTWSSTGIGEMLNSDMMKRGMEAYAEEIKVRAEVLAPVAQTGKHRGRYKASFHVKSQLYGGATHDRAEAIVYNDSPEAFYVEFAHRGAEPEHVLARAAFRMFRGSSR
jgi:hypothetical protein